MNDPRFIDHIDPKVLITSTDPDQRIVDEAKWLLDPPTPTTLLKRDMESIINNYIGAGVTPALRQIVEEELKKRMEQLRQQEAVYRYVVVNTTTPMEVDRGIMSLRVDYQTQPWSDAMMINILINP